MHNFLIRSLVALIAIPALLLIFHAGGLWLHGLVTLFVVLACVELCRQAHASGIPFNPVVGVALTLSLPLFIVEGTGRHWMLWAAGAVVLTALWAVRRKDPRTVVLGATVHLATALWIGLGFGALILLRDLAGGDGFKWLVFLYANLWIGDTAAYLFGSWIGGPKLAPAISPKKTIAGSLAQIAVSAGIGVVYAVFHWIDAPSLILIVAAIAIGIVGQVGDLFESIFKRAAGVKDFSSIVPGHGGILDRFDSTLLAAPTLWCIITFWLSP